MVSVARVTVGVHDGFVSVFVAVGFSRVDPGRMFVVMVEIVVDVQVIVGDDLVPVLMSMVFGYEQADSAHHEYARCILGAGRKRS